MQTLIGNQTQKAHEESAPGKDCDELNSISCKCPRETQLQLIFVSWKHKPNLMLAKSSKFFISSWKLRF